MQSPETESTSVCGKADCLYCATVKRRVRRPIREGLQIVICAQRKKLWTLALPNNYRLFSKLSCYPNGIHVLFFLLFLLWQLPQIPFSKSTIALSNSFCRLSSSSFSGASRSSPSLYLSTFRFQASSSQSGWDTRFAPPSLQSP